MNEADRLLERLRGLRDETACDSAHDRARAVRAEAAFIEATEISALRPRRPSLMLPALAAWMMLYVVIGVIELEHVFVRGASPAVVLGSDSPSRHDAASSTQSDHPRCTRRHPPMPVVQEGLHETRAWSRCRAHPTTTNWSPV